MVQEENDATSLLRVNVDRSQQPDPGNLKELDISCADPQMEGGVGGGGGGWGQVGIPAAQRIGTPDLSTLRPLIYPPPILRLIPPLRSRADRWRLGRVVLDHRCAVARCETGSGQIRLNHCETASSGELRVSREDFFFFFF